MERDVVVWRPLRVVLADGRRLLLAALQQRVHQGRLPDAGRPDQRDRLSDATPGREHRRAGRVARVEAFGEQPRREF